MSDNTIGDSVIGDATAVLLIITGNFAEEMMYVLCAYGKMWKLNLLGMTVKR